MGTNKSISDIIKPLLEHGDISEVAKEHGVTISEVSRVLHGKKINKKILMSLYNKAKKTIELEKKINSLQKSA
jgi:hypothetical protein